MSTKDWIEKDYGKTLGLKKDATPDQITKAFRIRNDRVNP